MARGLRSTAHAPGSRCEQHCGRLRRTHSCRFNICMSECATCCTKIPTDHSPRNHHSARCRTGQRSSVPVPYTELGFDSSAPEQMHTEPPASCGALSGPKAKRNQTNLYRKTNNRSMIVFINIHKHLPLNHFLLSACLRYARLSTFNLQIIENTTAKHDLVFL